MSSPLNTIKNLIIGLLDITSKFEYHYLYYGSYCVSGFEGYVINGFIKKVQLDWFYYEGGYVTGFIRETMNIALLLSRLRWLCKREVMMTMEEVLVLWRFYFMGFIGKV